MNAHEENRKCEHDSGKSKLASTFPLNFADDSKKTETNSTAPKDNALKDVVPKDVSPKETAAKNITIAEKPTQCMVNVDHKGSSDDDVLDG
eukprot:430014-Ditylum_brightwellii.AAC.1